MLTVNLNSEPENKENANCLKINKNKNLSPKLISLWNIPLFTESYNTIFKFSELVIVQIMLKLHRFIYFSVISH